MAPQGATHALPHYCPHNRAGDHKPVPAKDVLGFVPPTLPSDDEARDRAHSAAVAAFLNCPTGLRDVVVVAANAAIDAYLKERKL
jgi:hypothetical protein